jgi:hypothetical protein
MKLIYGTAVGLALLAASAAAQDISPEKMNEQKAAAMAEMRKAMTTMKFLSANGGVMGRTVKGAPYSAQEINESSQVLADGTRIHNETRAAVYRDNEGRVRREMSDMVTIWDPVANVSYTLNPSNMTAVKNPMPPAMFERKLFTANAVAGSASGRASAGTVSVKDGVVTYTKDGKVQTFPMPASGEWVSEDGKARVSQMVSGTRVDGPGAKVDVIREGQFTITASDGKAATITPDEVGIFEKSIHVAPPLGMAVASGDIFYQATRSEAANLKEESLGDQVIEGVKGRGTRTTSTIPLGAIGNDRPLNSLTERWYSDELQTDLVRKRTDPRTGEQTFRLIHINRSEPAAYLFQVPGGYTVTERK